MDDPKQPPQDQKHGTPTEEEDEDYAAGLAEKAEQSEVTRPPKTRG